MESEKITVILAEEAETLIAYLKAGDPCASNCLARLIGADYKGALRPFAQALAARLREHLQRLAELDVTDPEETLDDEVYDILKTAAIDWDGLPCTGIPGTEKNNILYR